MRFYCTLILWSGCVPLFAQVFEAGAHAGVSQLSNAVLGSDIITRNPAPSSKISLKDGFRIGFRVTFNTYRFLGGEFGYAYNRTQLHFDGPPVTETGMAIHQGFADALLYATPEGTRIRPFAAGGIHFSNFVPPGQSAQYGGGDTKFGVNYGAGIKIRVGSNWIVRFDFRQYETGQPFKLPNASGRLLQNEFSAGVGVAL